MQAAKDRARAAEAGLRQARKVHNQGGHLVSAAGHPLSVQDIRAHMDANNVSEPAFVTHAPKQRGARNFYVSQDSAPSMSTAHRTGAAVREGTADLHPQVLVEQAARSQGLIDAADGFQSFVHEVAVRHPSGGIRRFATHQQAENVARGLTVDKHGDPIPGAVPMRAIRLNPFGGSHAQLDALLHEHPDEPLAQHVHDALQSALAGHDGHGEWALVPDAAAGRLQDHMSSGRVGGPLGNLLGSTWRKNVLGLSPKWLTGNTVEAAMRGMVAHAGPRSYVTGRRVLKRLDQIDPKAAEQASARTIAGGHYSQGSRAVVHSGAEQFAGTKLAGVANALGKFWRAPGPKHMAGAWHAYTNFVFNTVNGRIESQLQTALLGKALREHPIMSDRVVKLSNRAIDEAAQGLRDTNAQVELGREVDRMYGAYGKYSPSKRRLIGGYTPFLAWSLNAAKFLTVVLPKDHPVLSAVLASANQATEDWRSKHGLQSTLGHEAAGALPGFLQGSIPGDDGSHLRVSRFTPFGLLSADGGAATSFTNNLLPQYMDLWHNLQGEDWKGTGLAGYHQHSTQAQNALAAAVTFLEGMVPAASQAAALSGAHLPNEAAGAQHEKTVGARARKQFDPFMFTQPKKKTAVKVRKKKAASVHSMPIMRSGGATLPPAPSGGVPIFR